MNVLRLIVNPSRHRRIFLLSEYGFQVDATDSVYFRLIFDKVGIRAVATHATEASFLRDWFFIRSRTHVSGQRLLPT